MSIRRLAHFPSPGNTKPTDAQVSLALADTEGLLVRLRDMMRKTEIPASSLPEVLGLFQGQLFLVMEADARHREQQIDAIRAKRAQKLGALPQGDDFSHIAGVGYPLAMQGVPQFVPPGALGDPARRIDAQLGFTTDELDTKSDDEIAKIYRAEVDGK